MSEVLGYAVVQIRSRPLIVFPDRQIHVVESVDPRTGRWYSCGLVRVTADGPEILDGE